MDYQGDFAEQNVATGFGTLHSLRHAGAGPKLLLLHGLGANTKSWSRFTEFLPESYDVVMLDLLGHGGSAAPQIDYTVRVQAEALRKFIDATGYAGAYIMGHSYGGWIAAYYAAVYGARGVILEDSAGLKEQFDDIKSRIGAEEYRARLMKELMRVNDNKEYVMGSITQMDLSANQLTREILAKINAPTLIVWGELDDTVDKRFAKVFAESIRGSTLNVINGAGHTPHYSHARETAHAVLGFIDKLGDDA